MSEWVDKPDGDGLWWRSCRGRVELMKVRGIHFCFISEIAAGFSVWYVVNEEPAKYHRCELTKPEPYVPPQPPKVKWYTATYKQTGSAVWLGHIGESFFSIANDGTDNRASGDWRYRDIYYMDIKEIEPC